MVIFRKLSKSIKRIIDISGTLKNFEIDLTEEVLSGRGLYAARHVERGHSSG